MEVTNKQYSSVEYIYFLNINCIFPNNFITSPTLCSVSGDNSRAIMDQISPRSRRTRKPDPKPDIYSTFVVHSDSDSDQDTKRKAKPEDDDETVDLYATMVYKGESDGGGDVEEEDDDSFLPPLLKRLPKDFGGGASLDYDEDDDGDGDFGTMIVKKDRTSHSSSKPRVVVTPPRRIADEEESSEEEEEFGTFVVKSSSKKGKEKEKEMDLSTMGRAVASMQESSFGGKNRKSGPSSPSSHRRMQQQNSKMSTTSLPDSITREDPTTKYEFLNELGNLLVTNVHFSLAFAYYIVSGIGRERIIWICLQGKRFENF